MSISRIATQALAVEAPFALGRKNFVVEDSGNRVVCGLTGLDALACQFEHLCLESDHLAGATMERIQQISDDLSKRLTYLLEPVSPIEINSEKCTVQMRSKPPQKDEDQSTYYELLVQKGGLIQLSRYQKRRNAAREVIPAQVTREVWARLVADFADAAGVA